MHVDIIIAWLGAMWVWLGAIWAWLVAMWVWLGVIEA